MPPTNSSLTLIFKSVFSLNQSKNLQGFNRYFLTNTISWEQRYIKDIIHFFLVPTNYNYFLSSNSEIKFSFLSVKSMSSHPFNRHVFLYSSISKERLISDPLIVCFIRLISSSRNLFFEKFIIFSISSPNNFMGNIRF